jgi:hypothetical protein
MCLLIQVAKLSMKTSTVNKTARLLMAMCLVTAALPPTTIAHAHQDGQSRHGHVARTPVGCDHSAVTPPRPVDFGHPSLAFEGDDLHRHLYVPLVGTLPSFPLSPGPAGSQQDSSRTSDVMALRPSASSVAGISTQKWIAELCQGTQPCAPVLGCAPSERQGMGHELAAPVFLCDRARHERSGVQLI